MEIIGDDKKLRALYSETRAADAAVTPSFTSVWHRAQARSLKPRRAFNLSFVAVTALLILTLGSLAAWSVYLNRSSKRYEASVTLNAPSMVAHVDKPDKATATIPQEVVKPITVRRQIKPRGLRSTTTNETLLATNNQTETTTIETWQSPTASLLSSPTDGLFKSLPQLNENANELKSSLPGRANEKEK